MPFVLFLQAIMFYIPHIIFKYFEGGKIKLVIAGKNFVKYEKVTSNKIIDDFDLLQDFNSGF